MQMISLTFLTILTLISNLAHTALLRQGYEGQACMQKEEKQNIEKKQSAVAKITQGNDKLLAMFPMEIQNLIRAYWTDVNDYLPAFFDMSIITTHQDQTFSALARSIGLNTIIRQDHRLFHETLGCQPCNIVLTGSYHDCEVMTRITTYFTNPNFISIDARYILQFDPQSIPEKESVCFINNVSSINSMHELHALTSAINILSSHHTVIIAINTNNHVLLKVLQNPDFITRPPLQIKKFHTPLPQNHPFYTQSIQQLEEIRIVITALQTMNQKHKTITPEQMALFIQLPQAMQDNLCKFFDCGSAKEFIERSKQPKPAVAAQKECELKVELEEPCLQ